MGSWSQKTPVATITRSPPERRAVLADGTVIREKIPAIPYARKMVTPSGNVVMVPLATGRTIGPGPGNPYGAQILPEKLRAGNLLYSECPYANGSLPPSREHAPCEGTSDERPGVFWKRHPRNPHALVEDRCCPHVQAIIERRSAQHIERQREFAEQFKTSADRLYELELGKAQQRVAAAAEPAVPPDPPSAAAAMRSPRR
jgi:hypothetical protein